MAPDRWSHGVGPRMFLPPGLLMQSKLTLPQHHDELHVDRRQRATVLVVAAPGADRDEDERALTAEGFDVVVTEAGASALSRAEEQSFDAVVIDVRLSDTDAFLLCRRLKSEVPGLLPVLHLSTGIAAADMRARGSKAGADGFLARPYDSATLRAAVSTLVRIKREDEALRSQAAATSLLQQALDSLPSHLAMLSASGEIVAVNRAWEAFAFQNGYRDGETGFAMNYLDVCARATGEESADAHAVAAGIRAVIAGERSEFSLEYPSHSPARQRWFTVSVHPAAGAGMVAAIVTHTDCTAEHERSATEARFHQFIETTNESVIALSSTGVITYANPPVRALLGISPDTGEARTLFDFLDAGSAEALRVRLGQLCGDVARVELRVRRPNGELCELISMESCIHDDDGTVVGMLAMLTDVTERTRTERAVAESLRAADRDRRRLMATLDAIPVGVGIADPEGRLDHMNAAAHRIWGGTVPHSANGGDYGVHLAWWPGSDVRLAAADWPVARTLATGETIDDEMVRIQRLDGTVGHILTSSAPIMDKDGTLAGAVFVLVDITERETDALERARLSASLEIERERLEAAQGQLREQFVKMPVPTSLWEARGDDFVLLDYNEAAAEALPQFSSRLMGKLRSEIFAGGDSEVVHLRRALRDDVVVRVSVERDVRPSRGRRTFDLTIGPQQPDRVLVHAVDTTERTALEARLRQSQKLDALGRLASGIAHDFNNLLGVMMAYTNFLLEDLAPTDPTAQDLGEVLGAIKRAAALTAQLLAFGRESPLQPTVVDVRQALADSERLLKRVLGSDIAIILDTAGAEPLLVLVDATQLEQVVINLAVNARDAMPKGGRLFIGAAHVRVGADEAAGHGVTSGRFVRVSVRDTGTGIDPDTKSRMFDPFFTTKDIGKGTGLGLATVYGIVAQSHGYIDVHSVAGEGATFHVLLPEVPAGTSRPTAAHDVAPLVRAERGAVVLLVEDQDSLRRVTERVLRKHGYDVIAAASPAEALALSVGAGADFDCLVTDVVMPGMTGQELAARIREQRGPVPVLLLSGYAPDAIDRRGHVDPAMPLLHKPVMAADLLRAIATLLHPAGA